MHAFTKRRREDFSFLGDGDDAKSCRYGVALLEFVRLHAGGPAGSRHAAAEIQVEVFGGALSRGRVGGGALVVQEN